MIKVYFDVVIGIFSRPCINFWTKNASNHFICCWKEFFRFTEKNITFDFYEIVFSKNCQREKAKSFSIFWKDKNTCYPGCFFNKQYSSASKKVISVRFLMLRTTVGKLCVLTTLSFIPSSHIVKSLKTIQKAFFWSNSTGTFHNWIPIPCIFLQQAYGKRKCSIKIPWK